MSVRPRRKGLAAKCIFSANRTSLSSPPEYVYGYGGSGSQLYRRNAVRRCKCEVLCRSRRQYGFLHGMGPGSEGAGMADKGKVSCLERSRCDGGRYCFLRDDGRVVQGSKREDG